MKYLKRSQFFKFSINLFLILFCLNVSILKASPIHSNVPDMGQGGNWAVDVQQEAVLGNIMLQQITGSDVITRDELVNDYLQNIALRFQPFARVEDQKLHFFCVDDPILNAFAFFGGHIAVHSGLILATETESELAAVLAHETAHIAQRHLARILTTNKKMMPLTIAQVLGALAIGTVGGSPEAGMHLANAALGGHMQSLINFTRTHEQEADRLGIQILSKAGFDPHAMPAIFERMSRKNKYQSRPPEYLLTHPMYEARIADAANRAHKLAKGPVDDNLDFHLIRGRLAVQTSENSKRRVARIKEQLKHQTDKDITPIEYTYALALAKNRQYDEAERRMQELVTRYPTHWIFRLGLAEIERDRGNISQALHQLQDLNQEQPHNYPLAFFHAETLLEIKKAREALNLLEKFHLSHQKNANYLQTLVRIKSLLGHRVEVHEYQAEWHFLRGEFKECFQQLELALALAGKGSIKGQKIVARKHEIEAAIKLQKKLS